SPPSSPNVVVPSSPKLPPSTSLPPTSPKLPPSTLLPPSDTKPPSSNEPPPKVGSVETSEMMKPTLVAEVVSLPSVSPPPPKHTPSVSGMHDSMVPSTNVHTSSVLKLHTEVGEGTTWPPSSQSWPSPLHWKQSSKSVVQ